MGVCVCHAASPGFLALHLQQGLANKIPRRKKKRNSGHLFSYFSINLSLSLAVFVSLRTEVEKQSCFMPQWDLVKAVAVKGFPTVSTSSFFVPLSMIIPWYQAPVLNSLQSPVWMHHLLSTWPLVDTESIFFYVISTISSVDFSKDSVFRDIPWGD